MKQTKEQKKIQTQNLRNEWKKNKKLADNKDEITAVYNEATKNGLQVSAIGFRIALVQMRKLGFSGLPYIDCKTFAGWKKSGFGVIKGQNSKVHGITWMIVKAKDEEEDNGFAYPKQYHLFHKTQVEAL